MTGRINKLGFFTRLSHITLKQAIRFLSMSYKTGFSWHHPCQSFFFTNQAFFTYDTDYKISVKRPEYDSVVGVIPREGFFWYDSD